MIGVIFLSTKLLGALFLYFMICFLHLAYMGFRERDYAIMVGALVISGFLAALIFGTDIWGYFATSYEAFEEMVTL